MGDGGETQRKAVGGWEEERERVEVGRQVEGKKGGGEEEEGGGAVVRGALRIPLVYLEPN